MPRKRAAVTETNALIEQLTSVLNAPFDDALVTVSPSVRVMAIFYRGGTLCSRVVEKRVVEKWVVEKWVVEKWVVEKWVVEKTSQRGRLHAAQHH